MSTRNPQKREIEKLAKEQPDGKAASNLCWIKRQPTAIEAQVWQYLAWKGMMEKAILIYEQTGNLHERDGLVQQIKQIREALSKMFTDAVDGGEFPTLDAISKAVETFHQPQLKELADPLRRTILAAKQMGLQMTRNQLAEACGEPPNSRFQKTAEDMGYQFVKDRLGRRKKNSDIK